MPFPKSERLLFSPNPLREVICQLRFPKILKIAAELPAAFQERIRDKYPEYEEVKTTPRYPADLLQIFQQLNVSPPSGEVNHKFVSADGNRYITLAPDFVAFAENQYTEWSNFRSELFLAKGITEELYKPSYYARVGLRYTDVVDREELGFPDTPWGELLNTGLVGVLGVPQLGDRVRSAKAEYTISLDTEFPGSTATLRHGLVHDEQLARQVYFIDIDFYTNERCDKTHVANALSTFNEISGNLIRWVLTDRVKEKIRSR